MKLKSSLADLIDMANLFDKIEQYSLQERIITQWH
jgi:hypothetical protein